MRVPTVKPEKGGPDEIQVRALTATVRRQRVFLLVALVAALLAIGGLIASTLVKSPAQLAAEQAPPAASVLTAEVRSLQLKQTVTVRATVEASASYKVRALGGTPSGARLVTRTPLEKGASVRSGQVGLEISGRPLFLMAGKIPAYRDLTVNAQGSDVDQLQQALVDTGDLSPDAATGVFDWSTQTAVARLYDRAGYSTAGKGNSISVPLSELVFIPSLPATVAKITSTTGAPLAATADPVIELNTGSPMVRAVVPSGERPGIKVGQSVVITDDLSGKQARGTVKEIGAYMGAGDKGSEPSSKSLTDGGGGAANPGQPQGGSSEQGYPVVVATNEPLDASWLDLSVRAQILGAATPGKVLAVPSAAIATEANGTTSVLLRKHDGSRTAVPVRTGMISEGLVEVTPVKPGDLRAGDEVVTG